MRHTHVCVYMLDTESIHRSGCVAVGNVDVNFSLVTSFMLCFSTGHMYVCIQRLYTLDSESRHVSGCIAVVDV